MEHRTGTISARHACLPPTPLRRPLLVLRSDQRKHAPDDLVDAQPGGVDVDGAFGRPQRRHRSAGVTGVAREDLAQQTVHCHRNSFFLQLLIASSSPLLGTGRQKDLERGIGEDDGTHVAAVRHQAGRLPERALAVLERGAHGRDRGDRRGGRAGGFGPQLVGRIVPVHQDPQLAVPGLPEGHLGIEGATHQGAGIIQVDARPARRHPHRPVQRAGVEVMPAHTGGHQAADRPLAGAGGAVDGQHGNGILHGAAGSERAPIILQAGRSRPVRPARAQRPAPQALEQPRETPL